MGGGREGGIERKGRRKARVRKILNVDWYLNHRQARLNNLRMLPH